MNNEPAFPTLGDSYMQVADGTWQPKSHYGMQGDPGMTLRDYFAAAALHGLVNLAGRDVPGEAELAFRYADAMLANRKKSS